MLMLGVLQPWSWCPMCGARWGSGMMLMMLLWVVVIVAIALALYRNAPRGRRRRSPGRSPEEIVRERYARGEIDREVMRQMLDELKRHGAS